MKKTNVVLPNYKIKWKELANNKANTFNHTIQYVILKAFFSKTNDDKVEVFNSIVSRTFTLLTNMNKLDNGAHQPYHYINDIILHLLDTHNGTIFGVKRNDVLKVIFNEDTYRYNEFMAFARNLSNIIKSAPNDFYFKSIKNTSKNKYYSYIIVDQKDIEPIYQAVQAAHVAMKVGQNMDKKLDASKIYYQIVKLPDDHKLIDVTTYFHTMSIKYEYFFEPDINRVVAMATHPIHKKSIPEFLKNMDLLTFN